MPPGRDRDDGQLPVVTATLWKTERKIMDHDIRKARIEALELYLRHENANYQRHQPGADTKLHSLFLSWYAEPYMKGSRTKTVALAKRMLAELKDEQNVRGQA